MLSCERLDGLRSSPDAPSTIAFTRELPRVHGGKPAREVLFQGNWCLHFSLQQSSPSSVKIAVHSAANSASDKVSHTQFTPEELSQLMTVRAARSSGLPCVIYAHQSRASPRASPTPLPHHPRRAPAPRSTGPAPQARSPHTSTPARHSPARETHTAPVAPCLPQSPTPLHS